MFFLCGFRTSADVVHKDGLEANPAGWESFFKSPEGSSSENLPPGISAEIVPDIGRNESTGLLVESNLNDPDGTVVFRYDMGKVEPDREHTFRVWLKGESIHLATIQIVASRDGNNEDAQKEYLVPYLKGSFGWTEFTITLRPRSPGLNHLTVAIALAGSGRLLADEARIESGEHVTAFEQPGLLQAHGRLLFRAERDGAAPVLRFPLPQSYATQVPLTFRLQTEPQEAMEKARVLRDIDGNDIIEMALHPMAKAGEVIVEWSSLVLCTPGDYSKVPKLAPRRESWPEEVQPWLQASYAVQSDRREFVALGEELTRGSNDVLEVIRRAVHKSDEIQQKQVEWKRSDGSRGILDLTALTALKYGGSCTSAANLLVALLRASGVPARSLGVYPMWAGAHQTHSIVEAYVPGFGWYPIESTKLEHPWPLFQQVIVSINSVASENRAQARSGIIDGVPYLQLNEPQNFDGSYTYEGALPNHRHCDHIAVPWKNFPETTTAEQWKEALEKARAKWEQWIKSQPEIGSGEILQSPIREEHLVEKDVTSMFKIE